jgi:hypothetical protein
MVDQIILSFTVAATNYYVPLGMRVSLNDNIIYENDHVSSHTQIQHSIPDADTEYELTFELFGKLPEHTKVDDAGNIVLDAMLSVSNIEIDGMAIDKIAHAQAVYYHDCNGTQAPVEDQFFGNLGCNGQVKLKFSTPFYLWLLENM